MSTEWIGHLRVASKEFLLALRSLIEAGVEVLEEKTEKTEKEEEKKKE